MTLDLVIFTSWRLGSQFFFLSPGLLYLVLGFEPRAFCMVGKNCTLSYIPYFFFKFKQTTGIYLLIFIFIYLFILVSMYLCASEGHIWGVHRTTCGNWFSPTWWILGIELRSQVWKQVSVPTELSCQPLIYFFNMVSDIGHIPFLCFIWLSDKSWKTVFQIMNLLKKQFFFNCWRYGLR